jgi:DNA-binding MarR family transcriptional regulator
VDYLEKRGYVESYEHGNDGRAKLFRLTRKGKNCRTKTIVIIDEISKEWEQKLGKRKMKQLMELLYDLNGCLEGGMPFTGILDDEVN